LEFECVNIKIVASWTKKTKVKKLRTKFFLRTTRNCKAETYKEQNKR